MDTLNEEIFERVHQEVKIFDEKYSKFLNVRLNHGIDLGDICDKLVEKNVPEEALNDISYIAGWMERPGTKGYTVGTKIHTLVHYGKGVVLAYIGVHVVEGVVDIPNWLEYVVKFALPLVDVIHFNMPKEKGSNKFFLADDVPSREYAVMVALTKNFPLQMKETITELYGDTLDVSSEISPMNLCS